MTRLSGDPAKVHRALARARRPVLPDDLAAETGLSHPRVMAALSRLEIEGLAAERGGRYRTVSSRPSAKKKAKRSTRAAREAVKSRRVCRVLWFDRRGRFAPAPKGPAPHLKARIVKHTRLKGVEGGGKAVITHANFRVIGVRYVPPRELREALAKAKKKGDAAYLKAYANWKRELEADLAKQAQAELDRERARETSAALAQAYRSQKAKKAAATRTRRRASLGDSDRLKAKAMADTLGLRIRELEFRLGRTKRGSKTAETLRRRLARWQKAKAKLEKIAQGKAYAWPKPSELR